ncbi:MAG: hypothetical protein HY287_13700 [Planctomycetes bacterium]|nr:hypothetical protein [Planctomycetota bacterium]MBI3835377.1 hypothetical protein [Planctomycetota bacterium]
MDHLHDDHHHHDHDSSGGEEHSHRSLPVIEEPLDAANQSLSDALRASFRILKGIMVVLVVLYLFSNVRRIDVHEEALVLRMGELMPHPYTAGVIWALPYPIDEIVPLPTKRSNEFTVTSHTFLRNAGDETKPLAFISPRSGGLHPALDGALLTSDGGLVHTQWKITYKFNRIHDYVSNVVSRQIEAAQDLIKTFVENVGIHVAGEMTAEEILRTRVDEVQNRMRGLVNAKLQEIGSGVEVTRIEMFEPTPPLQIRDAFDNTQKAENNKQQRIHQAEQTRIKTLNEAAGSAHVRLLNLLDQMDAAKRDAADEASPEHAAAQKKLDDLNLELNRMLETEVEGEAGRMIKDAGSFLSVIVNKMHSDVEEYRMLVPEYERNPQLLVARLWENTRRQIMQYDGVTKFFLPPEATIWLKVPFDSEQARKEEEKSLVKKKFEPIKRKEKMVPLGPEAG